MYQGLSNYLQWYQTVYGNEIRFEGEIVDPIALMETITNAAPPVSIHPIKPKQKQIPTPDKPDPKFEDFPCHQNDPELKKFYHTINHCAKCDLHKTRTNFVFGMGNPNADIMFIGEAPGRDEDMQGLPFVGKAGQLLDKMLGALHIQREEVYIANVLKCRPQNNRDPLAEEVLQCEPYLKEQIKLISPKVIIALGRIAAQVLLKSEESLGKLRQVNHTYEKIPFLVTYHPAALLRNPSWKAQSWQDLKKIKELVNSNY